MTFIDMRERGIQTSKRFSMLKRHSNIFKETFHIRQGFSNTGTTQISHDQQPPRGDIPPAAGGGHRGRVTWLKPSRCPVVGSTKTAEGSASGTNQVHWKLNSINNSSTNSINYSTFVYIIDYMLVHVGPCWSLSLLPCTALRACWPGDPARAWVRGPKRQASSCSPPAVLL